MPPARELNGVRSEPHASAAQEGSVPSAPSQQSPKRLILVSNRVPTGAHAGGLAVACEQAIRERPAVWIGWSGQISDNRGVRMHRGDWEGRAILLDLDRREHAGYYSGYANGALWPALHYRLDLAVFRDSDYEAYRTVNRRFAGIIAAEASPDEPIWIHDYHMMPLARELRALGLTNPIGFFFHIPFPSPEILEAIPQHLDLLEALMHADLVGFQSNQDRANFERAVIELAGGNWRPDGRLFLKSHMTRAAAFPVGMDPADFAPEHTGTAPARENPALILSVDRMDYSKGIPQRLEAIGELLSLHPELAGRVRLVQIAPPSRGEVEAYIRLRADIDARVGRINGDYGTVDWAPIQYVASTFDRATLATLYRKASVGLVTPLRDGMNLVAKEFIASQFPEDPGVLVLSRFAGAAEQLGAALIVNPHDTTAVAKAVRRALTMSREERAERHADLLECVQLNDAGWWSRSFLSTLMQEAAHRTSSSLWRAVLGGLAGQDVDDVGATTASPAAS